MAGAKARRGGGAKPRGRCRGAGGGGEEEVSEYERQRQERIRENEERLESLGLVKLSSSLQSDGGEQQEGSTSAHGEGTGGKKRRVGRDGDEEYQPSDECSDDDDEEEEEERKEKRCSSRSRRTPKKERRNKELTNEGSARKRLFSGGDALELYGVDDDDDDEEVAIQKAIALSLGEPVEDLDAILSARSPNSYRNSPNNGNIGKGKVTEISGRGRKRKGNVRHIQITEDEEVACFFTFDEAGMGNIALRDLQKVAATHDFIWSDQEMIDMINCFDTDSDGRLNFDDFHNILSRCNMLQDSMNS